MELNQRLPAVNLVGQEKHGTPDENRSAIGSFSIRCFHWMQQLSAIKQRDNVFT